MHTTFENRWIILFWFIMKIQLFCLILIVFTFKLSMCGPHRGSLAYKCKSGNGICTDLGCAATGISFILKNYGFLNKFKEFPSVLGGTCIMPSSMPSLSPFLGINYASCFCSSSG